MPKCQWVAPAGRRLAGVSRASVRSFVKPRPDYTCSNDTPALQPPATTAPVRAVPCWQDTTLVSRGGQGATRLVRSGPVSLPDFGATPASLRGPAEFSLITC